MKKIIAYVLASILFFIMYRTFMPNEKVLTDVIFAICAGGNVFWYWILIGERRKP